MSGEGDCKDCIDDTIRLTLDQAYAQSMQRLAMIGEEGARGHQFTAEQSRHQFLHTSQLVGAAAAARLDADHLAKVSLQKKMADSATPPT